MTYDPTNFGQGSGPTAYGLTAHAGGGQADATQLAYGTSVITTVANADDSAKMPLAVKGAQVIVLSVGVFNGKLFPASGENFSGYIADDSITMPPHQVMRLFCATPGVWSGGVYQDLGPS